MSSRDDGAMLSAIAHNPPRVALLAAADTLDWLAQGQYPSHPIEVLAPAHTLLALHLLYPDDRDLSDAACWLERAAMGRPLSLDAPGWARAAALAQLVRNYAWLR